MNSIVKKRIEKVLFVLLILAIAGFAGLFFIHYQQLNCTIEQERVIYVSEINDQLVGNILAEKEQQTTLVKLYIQCLDKFVPSSFSDMSELFDSTRTQTDDEIFLMDETGLLYNLKGERCPLSGHTLAQSLLIRKEPVFSYAQLVDEREYWFYGAPIAPIDIEGIRMGAILHARSVEAFSESMATKILNDNGYTYVASRDGSVRLSPARTAIMGYNIFSTLQSYGVEQEDLSDMQSDFAEGRSGQRFLSFHGNRWLVEYSGDIYDDWVVLVLMPMTITGADTYRVLHRTITDIFLLLGCVIVFVLLAARYTVSRAKALHADRLKLELDQRAADAKNQFLAKMSHDIRTPLNAIIGLLQITSGMVADRPAVAGNLQKIGNSAEYLLSLLNDVLDMSKIESGKMKIHLEPFSLRAMLDNLQAMNSAQAESKGISFLVESGGAIDGVYIGDLLRLKQILMNLLSNALKFTGRGGTVRLLATAEPDQGAWYKLSFAVEDTGIGMSQEYMDRLFTPFEQEDGSVALNYAGSGLGLSIVKNLVDYMNGEIRVTSEKGKGSRFTVTLRLEQGSDAASVQETAPVPDIPLEGRRILLAEDNELNAMIATELLQSSCGVKVDVAQNGEIAYQKFIQGGKDAYAAILMDVRMPEMDGLACTKAIRSSGHCRAATIPIIAMSANAFEEDVAMSLEAGMNGHLAKPINIEKVINTLKIYIQEEEMGRL